MKRPEMSETVFFGKVTAGMTHEFKNIFAIIKESAGLVGDVLSMEEDAFKGRKAMERGLSRIRTAVERGVDLATRLNRFAHSPDQVPAAVDLSEIADRMAYLTRRPAGFRNVTVEPSPAKEPLNVTTDPVRLQMAVFLAIEICLDLSAPGGRIRLIPEKNGTSCGMAVRYEGDEAPDRDVPETVTASDQWALLDEIMGSLRGSLRSIGKGKGLFLSLPEKIRK